MVEKRLSGAEKCRAKRAPIWPVSRARNVIIAACHNFVHHFAKKNGRKVQKLLHGGGTYLYFAPSAVQV